MNYISSPLTFHRSDSAVTIVRDIEERITQLDNLIELIVFTPRGSFVADPDFGFEYWGHEYSNVSDTQFNSNNTGQDEFNRESTKMMCEDSVRRSIMAYASDLTQVVVTMNLDGANIDMQGSKKVPSRHVVFVSVDGSLENGLGTRIQYHKDVTFFAEPTGKRINI